MIKKSLRHIKMGKVGSVLSTGIAEMRGIICPFPFFYGNSIGKTLCLCIANPKKGQIVFPLKASDPAKACFETLFLINTVPDRVIDESLIMILQKDAIIIDIASKPGGCDFEACKRYQINCTHALGLPGIYCPKTGAKILYDCMKRKGMTEGLWLFRIAP